MKLHFTWTLLIFVVHTLAQQSFKKLKSSALAFEMPGELNMKCQTRNDCRQFGYVCRGNKTCQCDQWYIPNRQRTKCVGGVDQKCLYDEHCIEGAYCQNQAICKCKETSPIALDYGLICARSTNLRGYKLLRILLILSVLFI